MTEMLKPIICNHKEIPLSKNYHTFKEFVYTPKKVTEALKLYKEGKDICEFIYDTRTVL